MSDPLSIGGAGLGLVGGIVGARGAYASGAATQQAAAFNQQLGVSNATQALQASTAGTEWLQYAGARLMGAQRAGYGAAGIDIGSGSPADVASDTGSQIRLAQLVKFYEGELAATEDLNKAQIAGLEGDAASTAAGYRATTSLLGAGSSLSALGRVNWSNIF